MAKRRRKDHFAEIISSLLILSFFVVFYFTNSFEIAAVFTGVLFALVLGIALIYYLLKQEKLKKSGINDIDKMDGRQFERYLELLFKSMGYDAKVTRYVGDYGADLILEKDGKRIVVQAKRYKNNVGINAIQEAVAAVAHYKASESWVVTNSDFTDAARELAESNGVKLINRKKLIELILNMNPQVVPNPKKVITENTTQQITCDRCGSPMVLRKGPKGEFYGCSGFPKCRNIKSVQSKQIGVQVDRI